MPAPSEAQRQIIEQPVDAPALLVIAGPGSGKTRVLCDRIVYLIEQGVDPAQITAVTFTQLAAGVLRARVQEQSATDVWTGTFHGYAYRILHEHGARWGFPRPIRLLDEIGQRYALRNTFESVTGWRCDDTGAREVARLISLRKRKGLEPEEMRYDRERPSWLPEATIHQVDLRYQAWLRDAMLFDYDELIYRVILGLRDDEQVTEAVRREASWLLVDEFQDVSDDQYTLISTVSPIAAGSRQIFAVADPRQSIYRFRGAGSERLLTNLQNDYRTTTCELTANYRSIRSIVACANAIQSDPRHPALVSAGEDVSRAVVVLGFANDHDEAKHIARRIKTRIEEGDPPGSIAVLYSTHQRADPIESALRQTGIPLYRHMRNSIHDRPEAAPLLALMRAGTAPDPRNALRAALGLNPSRLIDELDLAKLDCSGDETTRSPLGLVPRLATIDDCIARAAAGEGGEPMLTYASRLLDTYGPLVDAIGEEEWPLLLDTLHYVDRYLKGPLDLLNAAIAVGQPINILAGESLDARLAKLILERALPCGSGTHGSLTICLDCDPPPETSAIRLHTIDDRTMTLTVATQAWRLAQLILEPERCDDHSFVAIDLETTAKYATRAEIIEIGAIRFDPVSGRETDRFSSLVRSNHLAGDISRLTGIRLAELAGAPPVEDVLRAFGGWLRPDDILVGHNVEEFDLAVLNRLTAKHGLPPFAQRSIDTLVWCSRLLPAVSHKLEDLIGALALTPRPSHRAIPDAQTTAELMGRLLGERDRRLRVRAFDGALPLVAASLLTRPPSLQSDNQLLLELGVRRLRLGAAGGFVEAAEALFGPEWGLKQVQILETRTAITREEESWNDFRREWLELIEHHDALMPGLTPGELAGSIALSSRDAAAERSCVTLMTIHAAKGKEWPTVILIGAEEDQFPARHEPEPDDVEEGGRLFYVGITRAMSRLLISYALYRNDKERFPSRFLNLLPRDEKTVLRRGPRSTGRG